MTVTETASNLLLLAAPQVTPNWNVPFAVVSVVVMGLCGVVTYLYSLQHKEFMDCKKDRRLLWEALATATGKPVAQLKLEAASHEHDS
jgi:hypothetical protein